MASAELELHLEKGEREAGGKCLEKEMGMGDLWVTVP